MTQPVTVSPLGMADIAQALANAGFEDSTPEGVAELKRLVKVIESFGDEHVFAEAASYVADGREPDGIARGKRPHGTSKRRFNDTNHLTG